MRRVGGEHAARRSRAFAGQQLAADEIGDAGILLACAAALGPVLDLGVVGDLDLDGQDVADLMRALVLEEGARAVAPQRIRIVDRGLRRRHRHLHRLVAGLRGRVLDRRERGCSPTFFSRSRRSSRRAAAAERAPRRMTHDHDDGMDCVIGVHLSTVERTKWRHDG